MYLSARALDTMCRYHYHSKEFQVKGQPLLHSGEQLRLKYCPGIRCVSACIQRNSCCCCHLVLVSQCQYHNHVSKRKAACFSKLLKSFVWITQVTSAFLAFLPILHWNPHIFFSTILLQFCSSGGEIRIALLCHFWRARGTPTVELIS